MKKAKPWEYGDEFLTTLCESCHKTITDDFESAFDILKIAIKMAGFFPEDVEEMSRSIYAMQIEHIHSVVACAYSNAFKDPDIQNYIIEKYFDNLRSRSNGKQDS